MFALSFHPYGLYTVALGPLIVHGPDGRIPLKKVDEDLGQRTKFHQHAHSRRTTLEDMSINILA